MTDLATKTCKPCEGGIPPLKQDQVQEHLKTLKEGWKVNSDHTDIKKSFYFKNFYQTMAFVNAIAWIANQENHHPDLEIGYDHCHVRYSTHAINGLSINDFICAAKIDKFC